MSNIFTKKEVIDSSNVQAAVEFRREITYEYLRCSWRDKISLDPESDDDFDFFEVYEMNMKACFSTLSLDELEYIRNYDLFSFDKNDILDILSQKVLDSYIQKCQETVVALTKYSKAGIIGAYFDNFAGLKQMDFEGAIIMDMLGLNREGTELTKEGEMLKQFIINIHKLYKSQAKKVIDIASHLNR